MFRGWFQTDPTVVYCYFYIKSLVTFVKHALESQWRFKKITYTRTTLKCLCNVGQFYDLLSE